MKPEKTEPMRSVFFKHMVAQGFLLKSVDVFIEYYGILCEKQ